MEQSLEIRNPETADAINFNYQLNCMSLHQQDQIQFQVFAEEFLEILNQETAEFTAVLGGLMKALAELYIKRKGSGRVCYECSYETSSLNGYIGGCFRVIKSKRKHKCKLHDNDD